MTTVWASTQNARRVLTTCLISEASRRSGSSKDDARQSRNCSLCDFNLTLHTQENSGERDKESSLVIWNSRSGAMITRNLKSNIHPPKLFHAGWCQARHFGAVTAKPGGSLQTESSRSRLTRGYSNSW